MKRLLITALLVCTIVIGWAAGSRAQDIPTAPPTPTPDPHVYTDRAMSFRVPPDYVSLGRRTVSVSDLGMDPTVLAAWAYPSKDTPRRIFLSAESFDGTDVNDWDSEFEQQMRGQFDNVLFKDKSHIALSNGMPAMFMTMSEGEGFSAQKFFCVIWVDGQRGMSVVLQDSFDDLTPERARAILTADLVAVRYPSDGT